MIRFLVSLDNMVFQSVFRSLHYIFSREKDELNLQNSELQSRLQVKINECGTLFQQLNELRAQLQRGEANAQVNIFFIIKEEVVQCIRYQTQNQRVPSSNPTIVINLLCHSYVIR